MILDFQHLVIPTSVLREGMSNITLTVRETGAWISKNWVLDFWWMVASLPAYKIWHFCDTRYKAPLPLFYMLSS